MTDAASNPMTAAPPAAPEDSPVVLVAGAGGVIGRHVADEYSSSGVRVRVRSRRPVTAPGSGH